MVNELKFVDAAFPHNNWFFFYLCATPNFGKIDVQAATPPNLPSQTNYFHEAIIIKLNNDLHFWLHLTASRGRFDKNRSIHLLAADHFVNVFALPFLLTQVRSRCWRKMYILKVSPSSTIFQSCTELNYLFLYCINSSLRIAKLF